MKKRFQKLISLTLVLVMLVTMIPAGFFTASAEGDVITISTKKEWENLAKESRDFEGETVKLAADLMGITKPLADTFKGTFDGQDHTISFSTVSGQGMIANKLAGGAVVQNLKLAYNTVKSTSADAPAGTVAGELVAAEGTVTTIANVNVDESSAVEGATIAGGILGRVETAKSYTLEIFNVWIKASVSGKTTGGLIGQVGVETAATTGAVITVEDALIAPTSALTCGVVGNYLGAKFATDESASKLSMTNVAVIGSSYQYLVTTATVGIVNFYYNNLFVTHARGAVFSSSSYASYVNGIHCKDATKVNRLSPTLANIASEGEIEAPRLIGETDWEKYFVADSTTDGYIAYRFEPATIEDYENIEVFEIGSLAQWNALAGKDYSFMNKTVVLTADIDANGALLPTFALNFAGKFDGQGHTVKNAKMSGAGVIADVLLSSVEIQNVRFENITLDVTGSAGLLAGSLIGGVDTHVTISNISAVACSVIGTGTAGGLLGLLDVHNTSLNGGTEEAPIALCSTIDFSKIYVQSFVQSTEAEKSTGGLIGTDVSAGTSVKHTVKMTVSDTVTYCSVKSQSNACGLIGYYTGGNDKNGGGVLANATNYAYLYLENVGVSAGENATYEVLFMNSGVLEVSNLYLFDISGKLFGAAAYGSWYNGINMNDIGRATVTANKMAAKGVEVPTQVTSMEDLPLMNDQGFVKYIPEKIQVVGVQQSVEIGDTYALRFIAPMYVTDVYDVKMTVVATYTVNGVEESRVFTSTATLYNSLTAYNKYDISDKKVIYASDFGAHKLAGFTIYNIPAGSKITYTATMTYTMDGEVITSKPVTVTINLASPDNVGAFMGWGDAPELTA